MRRRAAACWEQITFGEGIEESRGLPSRVAVGSSAGSGGKGRFRQSNPWKENSPEAVEFPGTWTQPNVFSP